MKMTVRIESATLGDVTLESPHYVDDWTHEGRAGLASAFFDILGPRILGVLQIEKVDPEIVSCGHDHSAEEAEIPELPNEDEPAVSAHSAEDLADGKDLAAPKAPRRIRDNPQA